MDHNYQRYRLPTLVAIVTAAFSLSYPVANAHGGCGGGGGAHGGGGGHCGGGHASSSGGHASCSHASVSGSHASCGGSHITGGHFSFGTPSHSRIPTSFASPSQTVSSSPSSNLNTKVVPQSNSLTTSAEPTEQQQLITGKHQGLFHHLHGFFGGHTRDVSGKLAD